MDVTQTTIISILLLIQRWMLKEEALQNISDICRSNRPFVTVSFAQTLDGKIGLLSDSPSSSSSSSNYPISCYESLRLTHALRSIHDGIVIGRETMNIDNPQLTVRHWHDENLSQPRPIVLDTHLRTDFAKCRAKNVIVCCSEEAAARYNNSSNRSYSGTGYWLYSSSSCDDGNDSTSTITLLPCTTKQCKAIRHGEEVTEEALDLHDVLHKLYTNFHIKSVMVEGGARVLSNFIQEQLVDCLCVTISPSILAAGTGLAAFSHLLSSSTDTTVNPRYSLTDVHWKQLGVDGILCGKLS